MYSAYKLLHNFFSGPSLTSLTVGSSAAGWGGEQASRGQEHPCGSGVGVTVTLWGRGEEEPALPTQPGMGWVQDVPTSSVASRKGNLRQRGLLFAGWEMRLNRE